ncbi:pitrilysin family protein [Aureispira sp. CCB-E]|uniref:M16 family metallopeptidase n=1 Tax=Aureispira sp. CCB-E TaxID=3051121 RepID=UPI0028690277|nr:pitrilysin family protein [Aureispira sp. CCB-E]WMX15146.1 pitrilysin family protein [Aureispira sp. CCB-E]
MINRSKAPHIQTVGTLNLHRPIVHQLSNGIPVYEVSLGSQDVIKLELIFKAGRWCEKEKLIARITSQLLKAGSHQHNAEQLADFFEYYGASLNIYDGFNTVNIQVYCLAKHLKMLLPMLEELLTTPAFPTEELTKLLKRNRQNLKVQLQKNDVVAYRLFTEELFGSEHPYGYNSSEDSFDKVTLTSIQQHFKDNYTANNCTIFVSGKVSTTIIELLEQHFGSLPSSTTAPAPQWELASLQLPKKIHQVLSDDSLQASIRIGRRTFSREHPDCDQFYMLNMVLGGYFGARLMQNLREENGYTYGVYSSLETLRYSGYWYIHTDVGKDVKDAALTEIYREIERLQDSPIPLQEMEMVRNYTLGMQLTALDGVFNVASILKSLVTADLDDSYYYKFIQTIKTITPEQIQAMAQKYLNKEDLLEVVIE